MCSEVIVTVMCSMCSRAQNGLGVCADSVLVQVLTARLIELFVRLLHWGAHRVLTKSASEVLRIVEFLSCLNARGVLARASSCIHGVAYYIKGIRCQFDHAVSKVDRLLVLVMTRGQQLCRCLSCSKGKLTPNQGKFTVKA